MSDSPIHPRALASAGVAGVGALTTLWALWTLPLWEGGIGLRTEGAGQALGEAQLMPVAIIGTFAVLAALSSTGAYLAGIRRIGGVPTLRAGSAGAVVLLGELMFAAIDDGPGWAFGMYLVGIGDAVMMFGCLALEVWRRDSPAWLARMDRVRSLLEPRVLFFAPYPSEPVAPSGPGCRRCGGALELQREHKRYRCAACGLYQLVADER